MIQWPCHNLILLTKCIMKVFGKVEKKKTSKLVFGFYGIYQLNLYLRLWIFLGVGIIIQVLLSYINL